MSSQHDGLSKFRAAYLDFLEGERDHAPSLEGLNDTDRKTAEAFIASTEDAAGIDPYASRPSIEQLLERIGGSTHLAAVPDASGRPEVAQLSEQERKKMLDEALPIAKAVRRGWVPNDVLERQEEAARDLLEVSDLAQQPTFAVAARRSNQHEPLSPEQQAWLGRIRQVARGWSVPSYDPSRLKVVSARIPHVLQEGPSAMPRAVDLLAETGVRVVFCEGLPGGRLAGAVTFMPDGKPVIGLTTRGDRFDSVVFTLLHESAHLVSGHIAPDSPPLLDDESHARNQDDPREIEANDLASSWMFPDGLDIAAAYDDIEAAAHRHRVHPSCVAGRIQHESGDWKTLREHRCKVRDELRELQLLAN